MKKVFLKKAIQPTINRLRSNEVASKVISNSSWLVSNQIFMMLIGAFVTALVARYFGPEKYGAFNYSTAFVALFTAISNLGMEMLTVKSLIDKKVNEGVILCTSLILRVIGGIVLTILSAAIIRVIEPGHSEISLLVLVMSFTMVVKSFEVIEYWIQAHQISKISSLIRMSVYVITSSLRLLLVFEKGTLLQYACIYTLDATIVGIAFTIAYFKVREEKSSWKFSFSYAKSILSQSWYIILSGLMVTLYMRLDQVMLGAMMPTKYEVGIYSAAVVIAEMWYFVPMAIINSFRPVIMKNKNVSEEKYLSSMQLLYTIIAWTGIGFGIAIIIFSKLIVQILYGASYLEAASVLSISIWAGTFALLGSARSVWLISEGLQKYSLFYTSGGLIVNIILNYILIPKMGAYGAAVATLVAQIFANVFVLYFFSKTKVSTYMMLKAFSISNLIKSIKKIRNLQ